MKTYFVRRIGWVFDDDWYNFDGNHDVEGIYKSELEAIERVHFLNHIYFIHMGFTSRPFQLNFNQTNGYEFVNRDQLAALIASSININIEEIYNPKRGFVWKDQFSCLSKLSTQQVSKILSKLKLSFFNYYELESFEQYLFTFKRNPEIWYKYIESSTSPEEYYQFYDARDMDGNLRIANSIFECYYYAVNQDYEPVTWTLINKPMFLGRLEELSKTPELLTAILQNCPNVQYDEKNSILNFIKTVTPEELMQIDSVLIKPLLIIDKAPINKSIIRNESNREFAKEIITKYNIKESSYG